MDTCNLVEWLTMLGEWGIVLVILYEGNVALKGYRSSRIFDAIKYLEDFETRKNRRIIYKKLRQSAPAHKNWWEHDDELANAAGEVCARYNLLGAVTKGERYVREFITREWAQNICSTYEALKTYIAYRENSETGGPHAFHLYKELYIEADTARKKSN